MNCPVPVLGNKSKINQNRSIFQVVRGKSETQNKTHTSCCFMVWLVWIYWHKFSLEISIWTFIRDISRTKTSVLKMMEFTVFHRVQSKTNLAMETEKIAQSGNFCWNGEGHKLPNGVSILTFIKNMGNFDGVKLHWVCGKHFMNVKRLPFITLSAIFSKIAAATHKKTNKVYDFLQSAKLTCVDDLWTLKKSTSDIPNDVSEWRRTEVAPRLLAKRM